MARPKKSERSEPMDESILQAATELFAEHGFEAVSLAAIASQVGIRAQSISHHFGNKEQLYVAVVSRFYARLATQVSDLFSAHSGLELWPALLKRLQALPPKDRDLLVTIVTELLNAGRAAAPIAEAVGPWLDAAEQGLSPSCGKDSPIRESLALLMLGAVFSLESRRISPGLADLRRAVWGDHPRFDALAPKLLQSLAGAPSLPEQVP